MCRMHKVMSLVCCICAMQFVGMMPVVSAETMTSSYVEQGKTVTGTVKDVAGNPLIGVSVQVKGTSNGVLSLSLSCEFSINQPYRYL